jgi:hypothetical protein
MPGMKSGMKNSGGDPDSSLKFRAARANPIYPHILPDQTTILMIGKTFYLEASARTQDLLDAQQALQAAGCAIASTWHDEAPNSHPLDSEAWITERFDELKQCDILIVVCGKTLRAPLQIPLLAGHALARGLQVIWIGSSVRVVEADQNVVQFATVQDFRESLELKRAA